MTNLTLITTNTAPKTALDTDHGCPSTTTAKYKHISTKEIVQKFEQRGWTMAKYSQSFTKKYQGYQTHICNLRLNGDTMKVGDSELRILVINDHKGSKSLTLRLGLFRLVCSNGLVVSDAEFESIRLRHVGTTTDDQIDAFIEKIAATAEQLKNTIEALSNKILCEFDRHKMAWDMLRTRYDVEKITHDMVINVLQPRRLEDMPTDAWTVFNRVQENIVHGVHGVRRIRSIKKDLDLNVKMWDVLKKIA